MIGTHTATGQLPSLPDGTTPLDFLVRDIVGEALGWIGATDAIEALDSIGPLDDPVNQHEVVKALGSGILAADAAAVRAAEGAMRGRPNIERTRTIATLGAQSSQAALDVDRSLTPLVRRATRQSHVSLSLVETTRRAIGHRQAEHDFVHWVRADTDGFCRFTQSAALHAAGARVWDRSWSSLTAGLDATHRNRHPLVDRVDHVDPKALEASTRTARAAAIEALVETASTTDQNARRLAWQTAIERADQTPGTVPWSCALQRMRAEMGLTTWRTSNRLIADHVAVIVNDLPWIAGFVGMISLAAETAVTSARTAAVCAGAPSLSGTSDGFADTA